MMLSHEHFDLLGKTILERVVFQPPLKSNSTMQDEACFLHVVKGNSRLYFPESQLNVKSADSLVMKCGSFLNKWFKNEEGQANEAVLVHLYPDVLKAVYEDELPDFLSANQSMKHYPVEKVELNQMIENYVESLLFYFENPSLVSDDLIKIKVKEIILLLINTDASSKVQTILADLFNPIQYKFKEVIHAHLFEDLSSQDLAILTGYSLSSFKRKFAEVFDMSPARYIKSKRLEKAQHLLQTTRLRISEIAYDCGFNDVGYFSKAFHQAFNCRPSDFRKISLS